VTFRQDPNRIFDFFSVSPESMHMVTWVWSPRGIPANYRQMDGFGVNTYRMVNAGGEGVLVKYHWKSQQGIASLTQEQAEAVQARDLGSHSRDLYGAIERGEFPRWELCVQIMSDGEHPELDFDPLDDTKTWPEDQFPLRPAGMMTLNRNVENFFAESEQIAFGTGVLVDGLDFSDDKMLVGRTFSYSDTQRYRVGPNYLQLAVNRPVVDVHTNQRDGQMAYGVDGGAGNPHVNYEPSGIAGLREADDSYREYRPFVQGEVMKAPIDRENNYGQAGERYRTMPDWEREDLVKNLVAALRQCQQEVRERMLAHLNHCDEGLGSRVASGVGAPAPGGTKTEDVLLAEGYGAAASPR
jgi:catalase